MTRTFTSFIIVFILSALIAHAQGTGTLCGVVNAPDGNPVRGATVRVLATSPAHSAITQEDGSFLIQKMRPGSYDIEISAIGFNKMLIGKISIVDNNGTHIRTTLQAGTMRVDSVIVTAQRDIIGPERLGKNSSVTFNNGTSGSNRSETNSPASAETNGLSLRGGRAGDTKYLVDGIEVQDPFAGGFANPAGAQDNTSVDRSFQFNSNGHARLVPNEFKNVLADRFSTFGIDVDAAAYSMIRRYIYNRRRPSPDAVRIEEMINYFTYDYPQPVGDIPFSISTEMARCPWNNRHQLVSIGLQGKRIAVQDLPPSNLVFLIDVSGSMTSQDRLPLLQRAFTMLVNELRPQDRIAIVTYAGNAGLVLSSTSGAEKAKIIQAIEDMRAGGSTAGAAGINLAYDIARNNFIPDGNNRVILATDGDFNVGISSNDELEELIEQKREQEIFLTVLGVGTGNYQDKKMETLADKGNGNYAYLDGIKEAQRVLVAELGATLFTIAKDVKIQVEFNPQLVKSYRLIGYENRMLQREDFHNDRKDAGELGAGHSVTALYEIELYEASEIPAAPPETLEPVQPESPTTEPEQPKTPRQPDQPTLSNLAGNDIRIRPVSLSESDTLMFVKLRYKKPDEDTSKLLIGPLTREDRQMERASEGLRFASAVAQFGLLLRDTSNVDKNLYDSVVERAESAVGTDPGGYRQEFVEMVRKYMVVENVRSSETSVTVSTHAGEATVMHGLPCR